MTHETFCVLEEDHYGPCAPTESEFYVQDDKGKVLWREASPRYACPYSDDPGSDFQRIELPARQAARRNCLEAAFRLGFLPSERIHSRWTDAVEWPIEVREIEERGDLVLKLPMGEYLLKARRARKGETTSEQLHAFGGQIIGVGVAASTDNESPTAELHGRVIRWKYNKSGYAVQVSSVRYADGTCSGFLGSDVRDLERVKTCATCGGSLRFQKQVPDGDPQGTTLDQYECVECGELGVEE